MQEQSPKKEIFQTQPKQNVSSYEQFLKEVKNYTFNLNHHLNDAIKDQNKSIKRKRIELEKQLEYLRQKHFTQRQKIREMELFFTYYCENPLKNDIKKWNQNQNYYKEMFQQYQNQLELQSKINQANRLKIALLQQEMKQKIKETVKQVVTQRLQIQHLSKSKNFRTKKSFSTQLQRKKTKIRTQPSQAIEISDFQKINFSKNLKVYTEADQKQTKNILDESQKLIRMKTEMSLPQLKKSTFLDPQRIKNDDFNFMKPIGTIKKGQNVESVIPEIIKFFKSYKNKLQSNGQELDWFQKVVFNNRNFDKLMGKFQQEMKSLSGQNHSQKKSTNKVKQLVAKNLFRLKTESTIDTNQSKLIKKFQQTKSSKKKLLSFVQNQPQTQRFKI